MPNYRGGPRQMSGYGQEAVKAIREGRTEAQRNRDFQRKLGVGIMQAGITGIGALAQKDASDRKTRDASDNALRDSAQKYAATDYQGSTAGSVPDWLGKAGEGNADMLQRGEGPLQQSQPDMVSGPDAMAGAPAWDATSGVGEQPAPAQSTSPFGVSPIDDGGGMMSSLPRRRR